PDGITIHGFDGRELFIDGMMKGSQTARIQQFNNSVYVEYDGRDMKTNHNEYYAVYVIYDDYRGRYLDLRHVARLTSESPSASRFFYVEVKELGSQNVLIEERRIAYRNAESSEADSTLRIDLQAFYGRVPDYRKIRFYVSIKLDATTDNNILAYRLNRGEFND